MKLLTIDDLKEQNLIVYEYIAGSTLYGLNTPTSDIDIRGVYIAPAERLYASDANAYQEQVSDVKQDIVYYELKKYLELLRVNNPNILESLCVPADKINILKDEFKPILENKDLFITKDGVKPLIGYAKSQISKATGLNKKIARPVTRKLGPLDFCYIAHNGGSIKLTEYFNSRGLKQEFCGLSKIPNMRDMYNVYYDWKGHFDDGYYADRNISDQEVHNFIGEFLKNKYLYNDYHYLYVKDIIIGKSHALYYKGIVKENSHAVRLTSIPKGEAPICEMSYNEQGYITHCKDYREYCEWEKNRNPERFKLNCANERNYDCKNIMHCVRLLTMGFEMLDTNKLNVVREKDREFLLDIKHGKYTYEEIMKYSDELLSKIRNIEHVSTLREHVDVDKLIDLSISIRNGFYEKK